ncbi:MAG: signal recognition particle protein Srp19 [Methanoregulaceae archaeon]|nr:signal recognition particle protein Srp19 [Methanoregulaceae archaeon]
MKGERILYPCYFNSSLSRQEGRKVPSSRGMKNPTLPDLEHALKRNGIIFRTEQKEHPSHWWRHEGRIVVKWDMSKTELLKRVAARLEGKR